MPELPEVETVVRSIRPHVWGCEFIGFITSTKGIAPEVRAEQVQGQVIAHVGRSGKYIVFKLDTGYLVSHLRMTGQWFFTPSSEPDPLRNKYFRWGFTVRGHDGKFSGFLWFKDVRRFGTLVWVPTLADYAPLSSLGPDGLTLDDPKVVFRVMSAAARSRRSIKSFLLDQKVVAGVGNIYASEVLFEARLDPRTPTRDLLPEQIKTICFLLYKTLKQSIDYGGSSVSDYAGGRYHEVLKVYGRAGEPCSVCGTRIERMTQAGRGTFLCPACQGVEENELF